jgi:hypothetical protein
MVGVDVESGLRTRGNQATGDKTEQRGLTVNNDKVIKKRERKEDVKSDSP